MNDKKTPDDDFFDDSFEDEFNFDEGEAAPSSSQVPPTPSSSGGSAAARKLMLGIAAAVSVAGLASYFGYKFYASPVKMTDKITSASTSTAATKLPNLTKTADPSIASSKPTPNISPLPTQIKTGVESAKKGDASTFSESEIAALMKEGSAPKETVVSSQAPTVSPPNILATKPKENGISEQQKELFGITSTNDSVSETTVSTPMVELPNAKQATPSLIIPLTKDLPEKEIIVATTTSTNHSSSLSAAEIQQISQQLNTTMEAITKANQQMENNLNQIKYLDAYTREVSLTVEKLNTQITAMDNRIVALTNLANSLSKDLSKVRNEVGYAKRVASDETLDIPSAPRKPRPPMESMYTEEGLDFDNTPRYRKPKGASASTDVIMNEPEFIVHAVIPGRAWLKSCKGQIITLTEGEVIGNYGKVLVIDAANGAVLTSSGVTFR